MLTAKLLNVSRSGAAVTGTESESRPSEKVGPDVCSDSVFSPFVQFFNVVFTSFSLLRDEIIV